MFATQDPMNRQLIKAGRNQILDGAARIFAERGFARAGTKKIAQTADVSEGTIHGTFDSRNDLLIGMTMGLSAPEKVGTELTEALHDDAQGFWHAVARDHVALIEQNHESLRAVLPEVLLNAEWRDQLYRQFARPLARLLDRYTQVRIESGDLRPVNAPLAVRFLQGNFIGLMILRILADRRLSSHRDDVPVVLVDLLFEGMARGEAA